MSKDTCAQCTIEVRPETKAETPVVTEVTVRPGKVVTCKAAAEAANAAAHMTATEAAHMAATEAAPAHMTAAATEAITAPARKRASGQSSCESGCSVAGSGRGRVSLDAPRLRHDHPGQRPWSHERATEAITAAARKRASGQSSCESGGRR